MKTKVEELRQQIADLRSQLASAKAQVEALKRRHQPSRSSSLALFLCTTAFVFAFAFWASAQVSHRPGKSEPGRSGQEPKQRMPFTVKGTFRVVDSKGMDIFVVRDAGAGVYRGAYVKKKNLIVASMIAARQGGQIKVANEKVPGSVAYFTTVDGTGEIGLKHKGSQTVLAKPGPDGGGAVQVYGAKSGLKPAAAIDTYGGGKGRVAVFQQKTGNAISFLAESDKVAGTGRVTVALANGVGVFAAGSSAAGGEACVNRAERLECLSIDLPISIHIKPK